MSHLINEAPRSDNIVQEPEEVTISRDQYERLLEISKHKSKKLSTPRPRKVKSVLIKQLEVMESKMKKEEAKEAKKTRMVKVTRKKKEETTPAPPANATPDEIAKMQKRLDDLEQLHKATALELEQERKRKEENKKTKAEEKEKKKSAPKTVPKKVHDVFAEAAKNANVW